MGDQFPNSLVFCLITLSIFLVDTFKSSASSDAYLQSETDGRRSGFTGQHPDKYYSVKRSIFPVNFTFGTSSSAYQYEGAAKKGGRGPSIWDTFTQMYPYKIKDHSNGMIAVDSYHCYKEDVGIMKNIGFNAYRFSISWSRLLPSGSLRGGINHEGITYYNNLINELISNGLQPFVTIFHWDLPQSLEDEFGGFLSPKIVKDFEDYAEVCYSEFGDRVKHWITINEPVNFAGKGYGNGEHAPGRCSNWKSSNCTGGDSSTEPYIVGHHLLLAHAAAVHVYRNKYQRSQMGQIGIALNSPWILPLSQSNADHDAVSRVLAFKIGWIMEPLNSGAYPAEMVNYVGERLPKFSKQQSAMIKGSFDFIGLNYYTSLYAADAPCQIQNQDIATDFCGYLTREKNGIPIGPKAGSNWLCIYPQGIEELLLYTKKMFNNPVIYIMENGIDELNNGTKSLQDNMRIDFHIQHLEHVYNAMLNGVNVMGYFTWSLLDNFEWAEGYTVRFGVVYVDFEDGLKRYLKDSAKWFKRFLTQEIKSE